jgi:phosphoglycolate phosphatase-like HAD superfamily hydrolase
VLWFAGVTVTTVVLWDIDGTLVTTAGAGRRAIDRAFLELHGWEDASRDLRMDGRTDPWIVDEVFRLRGFVPGSSAERLAVLERYVGHLERELDRAPEGRPFGPLPGIVAALEALAARKDCVSGLLTGNIEPGARRKLERFDLWRFFAFGAYGDDAPERPGLLPVALERAARGARRYSPREAVVIGDTPRDVGVGQAHGARTIAVATGGGYKHADLVACRPDHVFMDLSDTDALLTALLGSERSCPGT